jgi:nucleotide-binding universal stress UspA family protein
MAVPALRPLREPGLSYRRLIVPVIGGPESGSAVELAAQLASERGAVISAVAVVEIPPRLPLDAHMLEEEAEARRVLEDARAIAAVRGVRVRTSVLRAREAGEAIVDEVRRFQADLVVLRAPRAGRPRRIFGKTVEYVLVHAPCRVLVAAPTPRA